MRLQNFIHFTKKTGIVYIMTAYNMAAGERARVTKINISGSARERLSALGIAGGAVVTVLGFSLFKSSVLISCGAVRVAIRRSIAEKIEVAE